LEAKFVISATSERQFPRDNLPEIAFLGRSNVGKSSLLNALVGKHRLAFTSSRPGCTQQINFFDIEGEFRLVDLPGYGYAKAPRKVVDEWQSLIEAYLLRRDNLSLCVVILDVRRGWMEKDLDLKEWLDHHRIPYLVAATKIDKLRSQNERKRVLQKLQEATPHHEVLPYSAVTGEGVKTLWQAIWKSKQK
jgi:GTP-binding protein